MDSSLKLGFSGALYHATTRGDRREDIYFGDEDREMWRAFVGLL
ncbi:MAG: hypothetical protein ABW185_25200 [Sedimenticola sp.]